MNLRFVLRRIALGLPLVVLPVGAGVLITSTGCLCGSCPPGESRTRVLSPAELDALANDTTNRACNLFCESSGDGGVPEDGSLGDAGLTSWRNWTCSLERETLHCQERIGCGVGRAPQGLSRPARIQAATPLAAYFADAAHLEAAAVPAFEELACELALHGAPSRLVRWARASAREERGHALATATLARRHGAEIAAVVRGPTDVRSLSQLAEDNAFEGCVREAFGAIVAAHQAAHASDPAVRSVMGAVARDEARHALLSLELDAWAQDRLPARLARRARERRREGVLEVAHSFGTEPAPSVRGVAGMPPATVALDLLCWFDAAA